MLQALLLYLILMICFVALFLWCLLGVGSVALIIYGLIQGSEDSKSQSLQSAPAGTIDAAGSQSLKG